MKEERLCLSYLKSRETIVTGIVNISHISSKLNYADILTKLLEPNKFMDLMKI